MSEWLKSDRKTQAHALRPSLTDYSKECFGGVIFVDLLA